MPHPLLSSKKEFRHIFEQGLLKLLKQESLGAFILVLANASFDQHVHDYTNAALAAKFRQLKAKYRFLLQEGQILTEPEDDVLVFLKLIAMGFEAVRPTEFRQTDNWELQFNHIRSFRPARISKNVIEGIKLDFDPDGFHFNKPFLQKERFLSGVMLDKHLDVFYNKFPFARFHSLLVPQKCRCLPQFLLFNFHEYIFKLIDKLANTLPGITIAYNSYGAYSSINHLHFHLFIKKQQLPITNPVWSHNGGTRPYPINCRVFNNLHQAWAFIEELHDQQHSYNLIYLPGKVYCIPRKHQGTYDDAIWSSGFAWYEVSGGFTTFNHNQFNELGCEELYKELQQLNLNTENVT